MTSNVAARKSGLPPSKRLKIEIACETCRAKKIKCDGGRPSKTFYSNFEKQINAKGPACSSCQKKIALRDTCTYHNRLPRDQRSPPVARMAIPQAAEIAGSDRSGLRSIHSIGVPGNFAREVNATVKAMFGKSSVEMPALTPMSDAPLFGLLPRRQLLDENLGRASNVLPPRRHADYLMGLYWQYIQPIEPFLDEQTFTHSYESLFAGNPVNCNETVFISSLNAIFALSTQIQECAEQNEREVASDTFFHRAWTLLDPGSIIWEPGSIEIVQCLLLMGRYLQCTNNPHQTWMAIGSAVRIAQSLGLHTVEKTPPQLSDRERRLRRQLWRCCVFMDRGISWVLGRTPMVTPSVSSATIISYKMNHSDALDLISPDDFFVKTLELYEINSHIMLSQASESSIGVRKLGFPHLYQDDDNFGLAIQLDDCLDKWVKEIPLFFENDHLHSGSGDTLRRQRVTLSLRFLHSKISLFRPMLGRICLLRRDAETGFNPEQGLGGQVLYKCATICVENAQKMINLVHEYREPVEPAIVAVIPWWYRIFYLHIASIVLIAAKLRGDIFGPMISESWNKAMSTLQAHGHLSPYVLQCLSAFQVLSSKIAQSQLPKNGCTTVRDLPSTASIQDIFESIGLEADNFLFGAEDMSWLTSFEATQ